MNDQQLIVFRFPSVRPKLQNLFPFDPKYDIEIMLKQNKYQLQMAYLRLQSGFFKNINPKICPLIKINENFDQEYFELIMKCFYGGTFQFQRSAIFPVWKIIDYLKIDTFKKVILKDIHDHFSQYNFFQLMTFGFMCQVQQIFDTCLIELDSKNFIQLKQNKDQFLQCPLQVFKFLINTHNRQNKNKKSLNYIQINKIIGEFCQKNQFTEDFYHELKFQLIEKTQLSAEQYRLIFIEGVQSQSTRQIPQFDRNSSSSSGSNNRNRKDDPYLIQSAQVHLQTNNKVVKTEEKQHWKEKLKHLKQIFSTHSTDYSAMKKSIQNIDKSIKKKTDDSREHQKSLSNMEILVRKIQSEINEKSDSLKKLQDRVNKLQSSMSKNKVKASRQLEKQDQQEDEFVQSHIIPGFCLGDILNDAPKKQSKSQPTASVANFSKKKKQIYESGKAEKDPSIDYTYRQSLIFDKEPVSIPAKYLKNLSDLMQLDSFVKKKQLNLIFRRSNRNQNIGDPTTIRNRNALLLLFQTTSKKYVGGYISVQLPYSNKNQTLCDYQSFIFSLTHNVKMKICKGEEKSAIALSKHYLLSFANDLMISNDCLKQQSYCEWPSIYEKCSKGSKCLSAKELVGGNQFTIEQIQIYQVKNQEIQMVL